jgi:hypothetical protein
MKNSLSVFRYPTIIISCALVTIVLISMLATTVQAETWYLMAPDEKIVTDPRAAIRMEHGPVVGPFEFTSRGSFSSRAECEPAKQKLVMQWRQLTVITRGSWGRYGFTSPSEFLRCVSSDDPQLKKAGAGGSPTMETFINRPRRR